MSSDHINGYNPSTKIYHSLRPNIPVPPITTPLSITQHVLSLLSVSSPSSPTFIVDASSGRRLLYSDLITQIDSLSLNLRARFPNLRKGDVAFILSPPSMAIPVLYLALLANGVIISPANPISSDLEIAYQVRLCEPVIAFASSDTVRKIPKLKLGSVLIDSAEFDSMISMRNISMRNRPDFEIVVNQNDPAAILYSSGTTGRVKGVLMSHRNLIALISGYFHLQAPPPEKADPAAKPVSLFSLPLFHVFGFFMIVRAVAVGDTLVMMERFDFEKMLKAVEEYRITYMPVSPPLIVALTKSDLVKKYDLSSLQVLGCGGAALSREATERFVAKFPHVEIAQGYGMTETCGGVTRTIGPEEGNRLGSAGRIAEYMEAKIVNPNTGEALPPGQQGELWLRGPTIMQGYVGDDAATAATLDSEGWLKTGDLCYFDSEGYLYIVDRLKELIKYKAYQVPPAELEHLLHSNPDIVDAAVIPYPDEDAGEIPMAFVVRRPGSSINEFQVMDFIAKQVAPYKKIRRVAFINSIPKSAAGKILRRELVNQAIGVTAKL